MTSILELPVLVFDAQSSGASPAHGQLIELAWQSWPDTGFAQHQSLLALEPAAVLPKRIQRLTGIDPEMLSDAPTLESLSETLRTLLPQRPLLIHFARFELAFLRHALPELFQPPRPLAIICTHELARRLLPQLPQHGLRAVAGHLAHHLQSLRRAQEHVDASLHVWKHLAGMLEASGIHRLEQVLSLLQQPVTPQRRRFDLLIPREQRLAISKGPGIYTMLGADQRVLYVGKARSLHRRVNSYFQKQRGLPSRTRELLAQVHEIRTQECESALEAALLEFELIQLHTPPYNVQLQPDERPLFFCNARLDLSLAFDPKRAPCGPWLARDHLEFFKGMVRVEYDEETSQLLRAALAWAALPAEIEHELLKGLWERAQLAGSSLHRLLRLGAALLEPDVTPSDAPPSDAPPSEGESNSIELWAARLDAHVDTQLRRLAAQRRRARRLLYLSEAEICWRDKDGEHRLFVHGGETNRSGKHAPCRHLSERLQRLERQRFERLRVLDSELLALMKSGHAPSFSPPALARLYARSDRESSDCG
ncbi:MAG: exonuclease domain-containing protein [Myxococcota bacterium]|nr:exonuclease domain-containing protein [Myxococcota bacterium]